MEVIFDKRLTETWRPDAPSNWTSYPSSVVHRTVQARGGSKQQQFLFEFLMAGVGRDVE